VLSGYLSVFTDEDKMEGGHVEITPGWPQREGTPLYAHAASVLPPIEAVFALGSEAVGSWMQSHGWERGERYNDNFPDSGIADPYIRLWQEEFPLYLDSGIYATLGGWHMPGADDDWHELVREQLLVLTLRDSEPWVEAWRLQTGEFKVIQRIT
jgi:hypothetical protein